jgi:hypothetical protein
VYSTWRTAAEAAPLSKARAVRVPDPVITKTIAFPLAQPGRATTSRTTLDRSGVRCAAARSPTVDHAGGDHATAAAVRARLDTFPLVDVNVPGLSAA